MCSHDQSTTRMHSSSIPHTRLLTVSCSSPGGGDLPKPHLDVDRPTPPTNTCENIELRLRAVIKAKTT